LALPAMKIKGFTLIYSQDFIGHRKVRNIITQIY
jgi:hypothetical protein